MKKIASIALLTVAAALPTSAFAETFDGPFVGVSAGYNRDELEAEDNTGATVFDLSKDSVVFAAFAGYDKKIADKFVVGVEGSFGLGADDAFRGRDRVAGTEELGIDPKYYFDLTARLGFLATDKTLIYARGGYQNARLRVADITGGTSDTEHSEGWLVGGGVEYALLDKVSSRVEYRYSDLGDNGVSYDRHQILVGVAYHF